MTDFFLIVTYTFLFIALYIEVYLLLSFLESSEEVAPRKVPEAALPKVAIFVPCYNEEGTVQGTIDSLLALEYPGDRLRVIAVNDGSTDGTLAALAKYDDEQRVTVLSKENGGKHSALNLALAHAGDAEIVGCLDADSFVAADAVRMSVNRFLETDADAVTPAIYVRDPKRIIEFVQQAEYALSIFVRQAFASAQAVPITPGPLSLFRRHAIEDVGGWQHAHGSEDMKVALLLHEKGYRIVNEPRARVITTAPKTTRALYKQRVRWTYGFIMNSYDFRHMLFNRAYGALGMIILPTALISIVSALYFTGFMTYHVILSLSHLMLRFQTVGFWWGWPSIESFYFSTSMLSFIMYLLVVLTLGLLFTGRSLAKAPMHILSVPLYVALYSFIAPWWLLGAVVRATIGAQAPWR